MKKPEDDVTTWDSGDPEAKICDVCKQKPWTHQLMIGEYRYDLLDFWSDCDFSLNLCLDCEKKKIEKIKQND